MPEHVHPGAGAPLHSQCLAQDVGRLLPVPYPQVGIEGPPGRLAAGKAALPAPLLARSPLAVELCRAEPVALEGAAHSLVGHLVITLSARGIVPDGPLCGQAVHRDIEGFGIGERVVGGKVEAVALRVVERNHLHRKQAGTGPRPSYARPVGPYRLARPLDKAAQPGGDGQVVVHTASQATQQGEVYLGSLILMQHPFLLLPDIQVFLAHIQQNRDILLSHYMSFFKDRTLLDSRNDPGYVVAEHMSDCVLGIYKFHLIPHFLLCFVALAGTQHPV